MAGFRVPLFSLIQGRNTISMKKHPDGVKPVSYTVYENGGFRDVVSGVIEEGHTCIFVNGNEIATLMCTPHRLDELAIGFMRAEGFIREIADIRALTISASNCVDTWLNDAHIERPGRAILTSGCGGGVTFDDLSQKIQPITAATTITPPQVMSLMKQIYQAAELYNTVRGVHTSGLSDGTSLLLVAQDIGRHNTIDRLWGQAMKEGIATEGKVLIASGRISSEMMGKAAKMGTPIIISRTSPTSLSVELARAWNITTIGYARDNSLRIYTGRERVIEG